MTTPEPEYEPSVAVTSLAQRLAAVSDYRKLGWPLILRPEQLALDIGTLHAVGLIVPTELATSTTALLLARRCPPIVLAHPGLPQHQILLASERYPVPLSWPTPIRRITTRLPPTDTGHGPVCWVRPPEPTGGRPAREFDVFAALRAVLTGDDQEPQRAPKAQRRPYTHGTGEQRAKLAATLRNHYEQGASIRAVSDQHDISSSSVRRLLLESGAAIRSKSGNGTATPTLQDALVALPFTGLGR